MNRALYDCAKTALMHRSGTELEDMYWLDSVSGKIVALELESTDKRSIIYSDKTRNAVKDCNNLVAIYTHPSSMPPSAADLNSCYRNNYKIGIIACHDGKIFAYTSGEEISESLYEMYIKVGILDGLSEYDAQLSALNKFIAICKIDFWEVV